MKAKSKYGAVAQLREKLEAIDASGGYVTEENVVHMHDLGKAIVEVNDRLTTLASFSYARGGKRIEES